ncbi:sugar ABC transporter substrate-binding protein [Candidatus Contubernalis alkaliaceticus]|uniref:sugar ABC transporter substrate-binding protein n=1 Tax=Candidatus Contubernalis alkaliaceticus TaxID=338645 RepID=UPI001F4C0F74|nr:sugar ABC transporter substrate-binding protein [Candidatus Contubernalis alkalaceticus]UNC90864.1 sugar ABC transporter substrate-binding protein [Candidatus Contubernalis alkalaceticus]
MKKIIVFLTVLVFMFVTLMGCGNDQALPGNDDASPGNGEEEIHIAYTTMDLGNPYFIQVVKGMEDKADELGIKLTVHDGKNDPIIQVDAVENFIVQKVDAIIISANDQSALQPMVYKGEEAGIPVISANVPLEDTYAHFDLVQYDYGFMGGQIAGQWIKDNLGGEAEVAVLGYPSIPLVIERSEGIKDGIHSIAPNAKIVSEQEAYTTEMGMNVTESILQAHPNVKVIAGISDVGILGAYEAVKAAGKDTEDFCLVGLDATPEAIDKIKENGIYKGTVDIEPYETGRLIIETTLEIIKNGNRIEEMIKFPMSPVTKDNIGDY